MPHSGLFGKKKPLRRYHDDIWIFDVATETWSQPAQGITDSSGERLRSWEDCPTPRGSHSACLVEAVEPGEDTVEAGEEEGAEAVAATEPMLRRRLFIFGGARAGPVVVCTKKKLSTVLPSFPVLSWHPGLLCPRLPRKIDFVFI